ncbi:1-phosphofructokinase [Mobilicoccus pelagius]|uniref:1-phosphofructokinase n=1 Tax=Mobilicoccus pelagius NBRC 104925 TaxID=1089455 RepID=H5UUN5_9MICO|nr:1-phosphofructokinase [Mobilicoccus pelagius]GAB49443.1 1-phosphofructokinase [Mobilicoccus pelagius NBRC 104925]
MIVTVTSNPSVDRTITVGRLRHGEVNRADDARTDPGGKGINVSRAVAAHGGDTLAVLPVGGAHGRMMTDLLTGTGVPVRAVPISEGIRANVAIVEPDGTTTKVNEPGPHLTTDEVTAFLDAVRATVEATPGAWVVGCGSLPGGVAEDFYAHLVRLGHEVGARVAIDTSGTPLPSAIPAGPDLVKPNRVELGELVGADLDTLGDVADAARDLVAGGVGRVLVSLGRDGALLVTDDRAVRAVATVDRPASTVGAGDCALAGFLLALDRGSDPVQALEQAVAFGAAAVALPGTGVPSRHDVGAVRVRLDTEPCRTDRLTD